MRVPDVSHQALELNKAQSVNRQQDYVEYKDRIKMIEITICYKKNIAAERYDTQRNHGAHAKCRKYGCGRRVTKYIQPRHGYLPAFRFQLCDDKQMLAAR